MFERTACLLGAATVIAVTSACHDDGLGVHSCPTDFSMNWSFYDMRLEHTEPERCPVFITEPSTRLRTGGTVVDGGTRNFYADSLIIRNPRGEFQGGEVLEFFFDPDGRWITAHDVPYFAGTASLAPDKATYGMLAFLPGQSGSLPWARMTITYTDAVVASISGPGAVSSGMTATWSASVTAGEPPFTYYWYQDWYLVGTESSYTTEVHGDGPMELRLDVYDARGEATSTLMQVWVSGCGTEIQC